LHDLWYSIDFLKTALIPAGPKRFAFDLNHTGPRTWLNDNRRLPDQGDTVQQIFRKALSLLEQKNIRQCGRSTISGKKGACGTKRNQFKCKMRFT